MSRQRQPPAWWYDRERSPPAAARVLAALYGGVVRTRAALYRRGALRRHSAGVPVVVVGNLIAGGSGKTPLVIALAQRLHAAGWTPGVATRGYGRDDPGRALWVEADTPPAQGGDEPVLIARRSGVRVRADRDRVAAAHALAGAGCNVVLCDDGLQHYSLAREIEIEVVDGRRRYGNGALLPAGPLREPRERAAGCDFRVANLVPGAQPQFGEWPMHLVAGDAQPLRGGRALPLSTFAGRRVHAVAGIGDPERFFAMLRALDIAVVPHAFPDHHAYTADDFAFGSDLPVLLTEKDAVKCLSLASDRFHSVPVRAELPEAFWVALLERLASLRQPGPA